MAVVRALLRPEFDAWVESRPEVIRKMIQALPPDRLYRLWENGSRCTIYSYEEDGTVTVEVTGQFNENVFIDRKVFGIDPEDLTECDLPEWFVEPAVGVSRTATNTRSGEAMPLAVTDAQLAAISEAAARYFCGWKKKPVGERRFPAFEARVREILEAT